MGDLGDPVPGQQNFLIIRIWQEIGGYKSQILQAKNPKALPDTMKRPVLSKPMLQHNDTIFQGLPALHRRLA